MNENENENENLIKFGFYENENGMYQIERLITDN